MYFFKLSLQKQRLHAVANILVTRRTKTSERCAILDCPDPAERLSPHYPCLHRHRNLKFTVNL
jgi:hypothetical protein